MHSLKVVGMKAEWNDSRELLVVAAAGRKRVIVEERDVPVPLIDLALADFYTLSNLIDAGEKYGMQMAALLPYIWQGERRYLRGAVVALLTGASVVVPFGFFGDGLH
jgi:hypothetical protein